jgi:predicted RNA binding protein YcfA (HicA-like mRNA interferase family)
MARAVEPRPLAWAVLDRPVGAQGRLRLRDPKVAARLTRIDFRGGHAYPYKVKVREVVRMLEHDGWPLVRTRGSHHQYKHPTKPGLVTIPGNRNDELAPGTLNSILKQAGLKP